MMLLHARKKLVVIILLLQLLALIIIINHFVWHQLFPKYPATHSWQAWRRTFTRGPSPLGPSPIRMAADAGQVMSRSERLKSRPKYYKYLNYSVHVPEIFHLQDTTTTASYFTHLPGSTQLCFKSGTNFKRSSHACLCQPGWFGSDCGIPDAVYLASPALYPAEPLNTSLLTVREQPRRVIQAFIVNHEFDFLETRLHELYDVVDVFLVLESNYSMFGKPKRQLFLDSFRDGGFGDYQEKLVYVFLDHFPEGGHEDGWIADAYLRNFLGHQGVATQVKSSRPDDLVIYTDADEIPRREVVLFLKLYDGYGDPIGFNYRWSYYGYFWVHEEPWLAYSVSSMSLLRYVYSYDLYRVRKNDYEGELSKLKAYAMSGGQVKPWVIGSPAYPAGWHCSWCFTPQGIRTKLMSAINADFPRWGDFEEKRNISYIKQLIGNGQWFDGSMKFTEQRTPKMDPFFAPKYMLDHPQQFLYLLDNLYSSDTHNR